jgi:hypothetical protein
VLENSNFEFSVGIKRSVVALTERPSADSRSAAQDWKVVLFEVHVTSRRLLSHLCGPMPILCDPNYFISTKKFSFDVVST